MLSKNCVASSPITTLTDDRHLFPVLARSRTDAAGVTRPRRSGVCARPHLGSQRATLAVVLQLAFGAVFTSAPDGLCRKEHNNFTQEDQVQDAHDGFEQRQGVTDATRFASRGEDHEC